MAKSVKLNSLAQEVRLIDGMYRDDKLVQYELYKYCADYFYEKYRGLFYAPEYIIQEIFQDTFIKFWEKIESRSIYAEDGVIKGQDNEPLNASIRTYFMRIAKFKYLEWLNENPFYAKANTIMEEEFRAHGFNAQEYIDVLFDNSKDIQLEIIANVISHMNTRCYEILTKFYYEGKNLDRILKEIPSIESKDALKTKKYKCMENLRAIATETYKKYLNSY